MIALAELTCRLRVKTIEDNDNHLGQPHEAKFLHLEDCSDIGIEIRTSWANKVIKWFGQAGETPSSIRPWNFIAELDGSVVSLPLPGVEGSLAEGYPIHFQIPSSSLEGLDHEEKVSRAEKFAMASLLYEIMTGRKPLQELPDDELRHRFSNGEFPDDVDTLPNMLFILSGWSAHFSQELTRLGMPDCRYFPNILTIYSKLTKSDFIPSRKKLCKSPSSSYYASSRWNYGFGGILLRRAHPWSSWIRGRGTSVQLCCRGLAHINRSGQGWQSLFMVSECGDGRECFGRHPSCRYGWSGARRSGQCSRTDGAFQIGVPYFKGRA